MAVACCGLIAGCHDPGSHSSATGDVDLPPAAVSRESAPTEASGERHIDRLNLMVAPTAINIDDAPGPDAIPVRVFFMRGAEDRVQPMTVGEVDFLLFDGRVPASDVPKATPVFAWSFTPAELARYRGALLGQTSYELTLRWDKSATPKSATATLVARYRPDRGQPVLSAATWVSMGAR